ncbi:MAG: hypothetical protein RBS36_03115 [Thiomicrospira sp.]|jgi:hypothetical protein|nr:hypothetical protein [Thiomicrospira sp.]
MSFSKLIKQELDNAILTKDSMMLSQIVQAEFENPKQPYQDAIDAFNYVEQHFPEALSPFRDGISPINQDQTQWSEDYYYDQKVELSYNFNRARFEHVVAVAQYLEQQGHKHFRKKVEINPSIETVKAPLGNNDEKAPDDSTKQTPRLNPLFLVGGVVVVVGLIFWLTR